MITIQKAAHKDNEILLEQNVARWFAKIHKETFSNGPQNVFADQLEDLFVIVGEKVLNKFEHSLCSVPDGIYRVNYARMLLFKENKDGLQYDFEENFGVQVKSLRYTLDVEADRSLCVIKLKDLPQSPKADNGV